jgi:DNA-binding beta-propeller fold protein YncE
VNRVAATVKLRGPAAGIVVDPVTGRAFVLTCPGCGQELPDWAEVIEVIDIASAKVVDQFPIPAEYAQMAADPYAGLLYLSHTGAHGGQIRAVDMNSLKVAGTIDVAVGSMALDPTNGTLYALENQAEEQPSDIAVIDPQARKVIRRISVDVDPTAGLALDPVRGLLLVSDHTVGRIVVVDAAAGTILHTIQVVAWLADPCENCLGQIGTPVIDLTSGLAYVAGSPDQVADDPNPSQARADTAATTVPAGLAGIRIVPVGFGGSALYVLDPADGKVTATRSIPADAGSGILDPSAGTIYLPVMAMQDIGEINMGVLPIALGSLSSGDQVPVPGGPTMALALDPRTGTVWTAGERTVGILDSSG